MTDDTDQNDGTLFESLVRSAGDLAGVFEHDGDTGYFYLYETQRPPGAKIADAIHVFTGPLTAADGPVEIRWDASENIVGLFIASRLWAVFDTATRAGYTGDYRTGAAPELPRRLAAAFRRT